MAVAAGTTEVADLARLQVYVILYALVCLTLGLVVLPGLVSAFTPLSYRKIMLALRTPLVTAFATGSSLIVLPMLIEQCKKIIAESEDLKIPLDETDAPVEVLIPAFYTFPSPMAILALAFIPFGGWYIGADLPASSYATFFMAGIPSLFGGTLLTIPFLLDLMGLPQDLFEVFVSVDVITSRFGTLFSAMHYATIGLVGTILIQKSSRIRWRRLIPMSLTGIALITLIFLGVRWFYSYVVVAPYTKDMALQSLHFLSEPQP
jgi:Na+/H+-dicarboxylate symporter